MGDEMMEAWMRSAATNEHHARLQDLVGRWDAMATFWMGPDEPPMQSAGQSVNTSILGGRWVSMHYTCDFMGSPFEGTGVIGFDNLAGEWVGNWMDTMCTQMLVHRGRAGAQNGTGPNRIEMVGTSRDPMGVVARTRNTTVIHGRDHHTYEMFKAMPGQPEFRHGLIEYRRKA